MGLFRVSKARKEELRGESEASNELFKSYGFTDDEVKVEIFVKAMETQKTTIEVKGEPLTYMVKHYPDRVQWARSEGATDDEIAQHWSLPKFLRALEYDIQSHMKFLVFTSAIKEEGAGDTVDEAAAHAQEVVRRSFPVYGPVAKASEGEDGPLPSELTNRVRTFTTAPSDGTYNAFVRHLIRTGQL